MHIIIITLYQDINDIISFLPADWILLYHRPDDISFCSFLACYLPFSGRKIVSTVKKTVT